MDKVEMALAKALAFFERRDEMNAEVHLATPRWSPITELMREALEEHYAQQRAREEI